MWGKGGLIYRAETSTARARRARGAPKHTRRAAREQPGGARAWGGGMLALRDCHRGRDPGDGATTATIVAAAPTGTTVSVAREPSAELGARRLGEGAIATTVSAARPRRDALEPEHLGDVGRGLGDAGGGARARAGGRGARRGSRRGRRRGADL